MTGGCSRDNFSECRVPSCSDGDGGTSGRLSLGSVHLRLLVRSVVAIISFLTFAFLFISCPRSSDDDGDGGPSSRFSLGPLYLILRVRNRQFSHFPTAFELKIMAQV